MVDSTGFVFLEEIGNWAFLSIRVKEFNLGVAEVDENGVDSVLLLGLEGNRDKDKSDKDLQQGR